MEFLTNICQKILNLLNKDDRVDAFYQMLTTAFSNWVTTFQTKIQSVYLNFFFDSLNLDGVEYFEELLAITPTSSQTLSDRRATIQAKWNSNNHNSITLIQNICNAWKNGEVVADFVNGKIRLTFTGEIGVPTDLDTLKKSIEEVKPAHIAYETIFKYLLIRDIHQVKTLTQMETLTMAQFARGSE